MNKNNNLAPILGVVALLLVIGVAAWYAGSVRLESENTDTMMTEDSDIDNPAPNSTYGSSEIAGSRIFENGVYVTIVHLTKSGFSPKSVIISSGEEVRFVNKTSLAMRIGAHTDNLSSSYYTNFMQPMAEGMNGVYQLAFTQPGIFTYYNVSDGTEEPLISGTVFVR